MTSTWCERPSISQTCLIQGPAPTATCSTATLKKTYQIAAKPVLVIILLNI